MAVAAAALADSRNQSSTPQLGDGAIAGVVVAALVCAALLSAACFSLGRRSEAKNTTPVYQTTIRTIAAEPDNARFYRNPNSFNPIVGGDGRLPTNTVEWAGRGLRTPETITQGGAVAATEQPFSSAVGRDL
jgi:hypothetical protein